MVMIAVRCCVVEVFASNLTVTVPLFDPEEGVAVIQETLLLTSQLMLEVILNVLSEEAALARINTDADTVKTPTGDCVTVMFRSIPPPLTVIVALRSVVAVFAWVSTITVPLFEPEEGDIVAHDSLLFTTHAMFDAMVNECRSLADEKLIAFVETVRNGAAPACVMLIFLEIPPPLTVMVAVRSVIEVLAVVLTLIGLLLEPLLGDSVNQSAELRVVFQLVLAVMLNVFSPAAAEKLNDSVSTVIDAAAAACVTLIVFDRSVPLTVMVADRPDATGLAAALTVTVPSLEPEAGETVSQAVALLLTVQFVFAVTVSVCSPASASKFNELCDTFRDSTKASCSMLTVLIRSPQLTVIVATCFDLMVFAVAVTVTAPFFEPEVGVTVSQFCAETLTVQFALDVTVKDLLPPANGKSNDSTDNSNVFGFSQPVIPAAVMPAIASIQTHTVTVKNIFFFIFSFIMPYLERFILFFFCRRR